MSEEYDLYHIKISTKSGCEFQQDRLKFWPIIENKGLAGCINFMHVKVCRNFTIWSKTLKIKANKQILRKNLDTFKNIKLAAKSQKSKLWH